MEALIQAAQEYAGKAGLEERLAAASVLQQQVLASCPKAIGGAVQRQADPTVSRGPGGLGVAAAYSPGLPMRPACPVAAGWESLLTAAAPPPLPPLPRRRQLHRWPSHKPY